jgi:hypothetical protein
MFNMLPPKPADSALDRPALPLDKVKLDSLNPSSHSHFVLQLRSAERFEKQQFGTAVNAERTAEVQSAFGTVLLTSSRTSGRPL